MIDFIRFIFSKTFLRQLVIAAVLFIVGILVILFALKIYTIHNKSIEVKDLSGLSLEDAISALEKINLQYEVFDSIYVEDKKPRVVIDQHPKAGKKVKKDRKIFLTINAKAPKKVKMPNLVGITFREAKAKISSSGLELGEVSYRFDMAKNVVLEQLFFGDKIEPNDSLLAGSEIDLVLGKGLSDKKSSVPNLIGLTVEEAKNEAIKNLFTVGSVIKDEGLENEDSLIVYKQKPISSGSVSVPLGTSIFIYVTDNPDKLESENDTTAEDYILPQNHVDDFEDVEDDSYNSDNIVE